MIKVHVTDTGTGSLREYPVNPDDIVGVHLQNGDLSLELPEGMVSIKENFMELSKLIEEHRHGGT